MNEVIIISSLLTSFVCLLFGLLVFLRNVRSLVNFTFLLSNLALAGWSFGKFRVLSAYSREEAIFWAVISDVCAILVAPFLFHFVLTLANQARKRLLYLIFAYFVPLVLSISAILFPQGFLDAKPKLGFAYMPDARELFYFGLVVFFVLITINIILLFKAYKESLGIKKSQLKYILIATFIALASGLSDIPATCNIMIYPYILPLMLFYPIVISYAGFKYRLLDLGFLMRKSIIYTFLMFFIMSVYAVLMWFAKNVLAEAIHIPIWSVNLLALFFIVAGFDFLNNTFSALTDKIFFRRRRDYQNALKDVSLAIGAIRDEKQLLSAVMNAFVNIIKVKNASIFILDEAKSLFTLHLNYPESLNIQKEIPLQNNALIDYLKDNKLIIKEELIALINNEKDFVLQNNLKIIKNYLETLRSALCLAVIYKDKLLAILLLGDKHSQDMYVVNELELLKFLAMQTGIAMENIMLIKRERNNAKMLADVQARAKYIDVLEATNKELKVINDELNRTQAQLVQSSRLSAIGELAGGVAHEVNNPLTGVLGNAQLLKLKAHSKPDAKISDYQSILDAIESSAMRCSTIIRGLLEFSRTKKKSPQVSDLNELIKSTLILIDHMFEVDGIKFMLELSPKPVLVMVNPGQIQQVFLNIISNSRWAIKAKNKTGTIKIKTIIREDGNSAIISLTDDGIGIPEKDMPRLFEPFFSTKPAGEGVGLGLSISWGIIQEHKGNIKVESKFQEFAKFDIELPIYKQQSATIT